MMKNLIFDLENGEVDLYTSLTYMRVNTGLVLHYNQFGYTISPCKVILHNYKPCGSSGRRLSLVSVA